MNRYSYFMLGPCFDIWYKSQIDHGSVVLPVIVLLSLGHTFGCAVSMSLTVFCSTDVLILMVPKHYATSGSAASKTCHYLCL